MCENHAICVRVGNPDKYIDTIYRIIYIYIYILDCLFEVTLMCMRFSWHNTCVAIRRLNHLLDDELFTDPNVNYEILAKVLQPAKLSTYPR